MPEPSSKPASFTGVTRRRTTRFSVRAGDVISRLMITIGGIGTILAVLMVCVLLVVVVVPLFLPGTVTSEHQTASPWAGGPRGLSVDEHRMIGWAVLPDGSLSVIRLDTGKPLDTPRLDPRVPTAMAFSLDGKDVAMGFDDGTVRLAQIIVATRFLSPADLVEGVEPPKPGQIIDYQGGLLTRPSADTLRLHKLSILAREPIKAADSAIKLIALSPRGEEPVLAVLTADGQLLLEQVKQRRHLMTGKITLTVKKTQLPYQPPAAGRPGPDWLLLNGLGSNALLIWRDGAMIRYDARQDMTPSIAEALDLVPEEGQNINCVGQMPGLTTLLVGDSLGRLRAWFRITPDLVGVTPAGHGLIALDSLTTQVARQLPAPKPHDLPPPLAARTDLRVIQSPDRGMFVMGHDLSGPDSPVTMLAPSGRSRLLGVGYANGQVRLVQVTSHKIVLDLKAPQGQPVQALTIAPKEDAVLALGGGQLHQWAFDPGYPEATLSALFGRVWYEGYPFPQWVWQSTGGTDDFEPKLSLVPLIFGTLKATLYSMLIALPLGLLAAIYTSEFLNPSIKSTVKPAIEIMASLPSVVLGFLAALVIAPVVEHIVPALLSSFVTLPLAVLIGAGLWQLLPPHLTRRLEQIGADADNIHGFTGWMGRLVFGFGGMRILAIITAVALGLLAAAALGPLTENLFFGGSIRSWLAWQPQSATGPGDPLANSTGGLFILLLPVTALVVAVAMGLYVNPWIKQRALLWQHTATATTNLAKFVLGCLAAIALALLLALLLNALGFDPRGQSLLPPDVFGRYDQRNALIIGFAMGFAVIPIIYTISEDALSSVPAHLRSASLGAGATPWQTAIRIVIPTATSGLFSAGMIGLGRAVGETMIVLMALGNTPTMQWNIFDGARTLSANIAVEMPEAVRGSTHYRTLFLAGLTLFILTFFLNTAAEAVRLRFRKKAVQL